MKTRGEINLAAAKRPVMNRAGSNEFYTLSQIKSEGLHGCMIEWNTRFKLIDKLVNNFKGWRDNHEHTAYIQVCE